MGRIIRGLSARARDAAGRAKAFMVDYAYLMTLGAALMVVAASALYTAQLRRESGIQAAADAPEVAQTAMPTALPSATPVPLATMAPMQISASVKLGGSTVRPVAGKALRAYDVQEPVYWEALGSVQMHEGLDLAGEAGTDVLCAMDGTVTKAVRDELWGWRVEVAQTDGQSAVYAGLESSYVTAEQIVTRGQALGALLEAIPCEAELGTHLHMELSEGGESRDPQTILP